MYDSVGVSRNRCLLSTCLRFQKFVIKYATATVLLFTQPVNLRPFRAHCQMDKEQAQNIWKSLSSAVTEIYNKNASLLSFEELYR